MHPYYSTYLKNLRTLNEELKALLLGAPPPALDWIPAGESNSLAVLGAHVAGSQKYWLGDVLGSRESERDRDAEFSTRGQDAAALAGRLDAAMADVSQVLEPLTLDSLAEARRSPRHDRLYGVDWILLHALEHTAQHLGHAQLTRQLSDGPPQT